MQGTLTFEDTGADRACCMGEHFSIMAPTDCGCKCHKVKTDRYGRDANGNFPGLE